MTDENLILLALKELPSNPTKKPWMTAGLLARRIMKNQNILVTVDDLEKVLQGESARVERRIRYSTYPSARSLRILWGAISSVKDRCLPSLVLHEGDSQKEVSRHLENYYPMVFVSHNYRDKEHVVSLCNKMESSGVSTWIYESKLQKGDTIINEVREAIDKCPLCILYLTMNSIGSSWVRKEVLHARGNVRIVVNKSVYDLLMYINKPNNCIVEFPESLLENCNSVMQRDNARKLMTYVYDCFLKDKAGIFVHDESYPNNIDELVKDVQVTCGRIVES